MRQSGLTAILLLTLAVGGAGIYLTQRGLQAELGRVRPVGAVLIQPSAGVIRRLSLGFAGALADLYWIRAVQYYGRRAFRPGQRFDLLGPLLSRVTQLDPQFIAAYQFGAVFLALPPPGGPGRPEAAIALLDRGIRHNPDQWRLILDKGFVYAWDLHEYGKAAEVFASVRHHPRAPAWVADLAAEMYTRAGRRQAARRIWQDRYEHAENRQIRERAALHLASLQALEQIEQLEAVIARYRRRTGKWPAAWDELVAAGRLRRAPVDPLGFPYRLEAGTGQVRLAPQSPLVLPRL